MSIITNLPTSNVPTARQRTPEQQALDAQFAGMWINVGMVGTTQAEDGSDESEPEFIRLRGIAVSDLVTRPIYPNSDPDRAAQTQMMNDVVEAIREKAMELKEGEGVKLELDVQLYRRQEEVQISTNTSDKSEMKARLFG